MNARVLGNALSLLGPILLLWGAALYPLVGSLWFWLLTAGLLTWVAWSQGIRRMLIVAAFSPVLLFVLHFGVGTVRYFDGDAVLDSYGYRAGPNRHEIHPVTRQPVHERNCMAPPWYEFTDGAENRALLVWSSVLGPTGGAYDGPLPDVHEVRAVLRTAPEPVHARLTSDRRGLTFDDPRLTGVVETQSGAAVDAYDRCMDARKAREMAGIAATAGARHSMDCARLLDEPRPPTEFELSAAFFGDKQSGCVAVELPGPQGRLVLLRQGSLETLREYGKTDLGSR
ncbi:MAG: hypothetical protein R3A78_07115 [Polyangiales bacterium]